MAGSSTTATRIRSLRASPAAICISTDWSSPRAASGSTAVNPPAAAGTSGTRQPPDAAARPSSPTGVTSSAGFSSPARPLMSLATTSCRPRISVATPSTTATARSGSAVAGPPGTLQASVGGAIRTRDGAATPSQGATSRLADTRRLLGARSSYTHAAAISAASAYANLSAGPRSTSPSPDMPDSCRAARRRSDLTIKGVVSSAWACASTALTTSLCRSGCSRSSIRAA